MWRIPIVRWLTVLFALMLPVALWFAFSLHEARAALSARFMKLSGQHRQAIEELELAEAVQKRLAEQLAAEHALHNRVRERNLERIGVYTEQRQARYFTEWMDREQLLDLEEQVMLLQVPELVGELLAP